MSLTIRVVDCQNGRAAESVSLVLSGPHAQLARGSTDEKGIFRYSGSSNGDSHHGVYQLDLDIDSYYASLGLIPFYRKIATILRLADAEQDYVVAVLITANSFVSYVTKGNAPGGN
jgi:5-hydroxyisourate hydrolase-like protein (transthyretin family)